jgi:hypothetical protein
LIYREGGVQYKDVVTRRIILTAQVISKDDLRVRIVRITSVAEKLGNILNVLAASPEFVLASFVVDANEEGLLS